MNVKALIHHLSTLPQELPVLLRIDLEEMRGTWETSSGVCRPFEFSDLEVVWARGTEAISLEIAVREMPSSGEEF